MSMNARRYQCRVLATEWVTPSVIRVAFEPHKKLKYEPGQFISLAIPDPQGSSKPIRRAYSFTDAYENAAKNGYEICVKFVENGIGSQFLKELQVGDSFECTAPYGDFVYHRPKSGRSVCFVATGTGISPLRSMALSQEFQNHLPLHSNFLFGARHEDEILYPGSFESVGIETVVAISQPKTDFKGFHGRITDYLKTLPIDWGWHTTDFYLCGNGEMVEEVSRILMGGHGVSESSIYREVFFANRRNLSREEEDAQFSNKKVA